VIGICFKSVEEPLASEVLAQAIPPPECVIVKVPHFGWFVNLVRQSQGHSREQVIIRSPDFHYSYTKSP